MKGKPIKLDLIGVLEQEQADILCARAQGHIEKVRPDSHCLLHSLVRIAPVSFLALRAPEQQRFPDDRVVALGREALLEEQLDHVEALRSDSGVDGRQLFE
ncbi:uncharacterized protein PG986_003971 [Apiospora aurea]|uniref:Uncharacterized protein n=1 Tax=Apiospora aurea TaxID=335848 RepID=A0ABR1QL89_9PEZI